MTTITIITSGVLMILIFVQMHNSMRIEERRQELEELMDKSNHVISKFDSVFKDMEGTNRSYAAVINRISELRKENDSLTSQNQSLLRENKDLDWQNQNLKSYNRKLTQKNQTLNEKQSQYEQAIIYKQSMLGSLTECIDDLKAKKVGLEISISKYPAKEIDILSKKVSILGLKKHITDKLEADGIICIGDIVKYSEEGLLSATGITNRSLDSIKSALHTNNLMLGMNVTCINYVWYQQVPYNMMME